VVGGPGRGGGLLVCACACRAVGRGRSGRLAGLPPPNQVPRLATLGEAGDLARGVSQEDVAIARLSGGEEDVRRLGPQDLGLASRLLAFESVSGRANLVKNPRGEFIRARVLAAER